MYIKRVLPVFLTVAVFFCSIGVFPAYAAGEVKGQMTSGTDYILAAEMLKDLGLIAGTGTGFAQDRPATRAEGIVIFLRLIGEGDGAEHYDGAHPFGDVPAWAEHWVGYAWSKGYTAGIGRGVFGSDDEMTAPQFLTFVLKALGYDSNSDFTWSKAVDYSCWTGLITQEDRAFLNNTTDKFMRDEIFYLMDRALSQYDKDEKEMLYEKLIARGAIKKDALYGECVKRGEPEDGIRLALESGYRDYYYEKLSDEVDKRSGTSISQDYKTQLKDWGYQKCKEMPLYKYPYILKNISKLEVYLGTTEDYSDLEHALGYVTGLQDETGLLWAGIYMRAASDAEENRSTFYHELEHLKGMGLSGFGFGRNEYIYETRGLEEYTAEYFTCALIGTRNSGYGGVFGYNVMQSIQVLMGGNMLLEAYAQSNLEGFSAEWDRQYSSVVPFSRVAILIETLVKEYISSDTLSKVYISAKNELTDKFAECYKIRMQKLIDGELYKEGDKEFLVDQTIIFLQNLYYEEGKTNSIAGCYGKKGTETAGEIFKAFGAKTGVSQQVCMKLFDINKGTEYRMECYGKNKNRVFTMNGNTPVEKKY